MNLREYDKLRGKIKIKDFEGKNRGLDKWLYRISFVGNFGSIFFAYFLVYPILFKAISVNLINGVFGNIMAFILSVTFLTIFEIIKRYLLRNFSSDFVSNNRKISFSILGWFILSMTILLLSFYLSLMGSKEFVSISNFKNNVAEVQSDVKEDSINNLYKEKYTPYLNDNIELRKINNDLRNKLLETPIEYRSVRNDYQRSIDKNDAIIKDNEKIIKDIENEAKNAVLLLKTDLNTEKNENKNEESKSITLIIIIAIFVEILIIGGVYFREYYEDKMYYLNKDKFEKIYQKRDRYRALLTYIYSNGKIKQGERVMSGIMLKELISKKSTIQNPNKFIDEFLHDMDRFGIFNTHGKRRFITISFEDALKIIDEMEDGLQILEDLK